MTSGEKMIWAAVYANSLQAGFAVEVAYKSATSAVLALRAVQVDELSPIWERAIRSMRESD